MIGAYFIRIKLKDREVKINLAQVYSVLYYPNDRIEIEYDNYIDIIRPDDCKNLEEIYNKFPS